MHKFFVLPAKAGIQRKKNNWVPAFAGLTMVLVASPALAQDKHPPYWASIASGQAMTRTGPGKNYPGVWLYQRRDLPIRVVKKYQNWRLIQDPDGAQGWMLGTLLSDRRTTHGIFHVTEGGLPIPDDKIGVPKITFGKMLGIAVNPPRHTIRRRTAL